jgi:hypothetical protein
VQIAIPLRQAETGTPITEMPEDVSVGAILLLVEEEIPFTQAGEQGGE